MELASVDESASFGYEQFEEFLRESAVVHLSAVINLHLSHSNRRSLEGIPEAPIGCRCRRDKWSGLLQLGVKFFCRSELGRDTLE